MIPAVAFEMRSPPGVDADGRPREAVEYVRLSVGKDVVCRRATDDDRQRFKVEYAAFKAPTPAAEPAPTAGPVGEPEAPVKASKVGAVLKGFGKRKA